MLIISVFSLCLVEVTHQEHVHLVEVDAPEVTHVDDTLSMLRNFPRGHFHADGGGTVSNYV